MADTPKKPKGRGRTSLSLSKRLNKRLSSPQSCMQDEPNAVEVQSSPRVSFNTEVKEFTPPHKKLNLDDSMDDSPMSFEGSCSPTAFLSQTFGADSPEVGWHWKQEEFIGEMLNTKTDSGFSSRNCSSSTDSHKSHARSETHRQAYNKKREERRRAKELKIRKAERARVEALLRDRLASLASQFKGVRTLIEQPQENEEIIKTDIVEKTPTTTEYVFNDIDMNIFEESNIDFDDPKPTTTSVKKVENISSLDDFFNDSDTDCLLVAATQQLESVMPELSQRITQTPKSESPKKITNTYSANKEKRSSLYMKFLEDDEDDIFVSLDDSWLKKAEQSSKPRSPFQRYKSMPTSTTTSTSSSKSLADSKAAASNNKKLFSDGSGIRNATNATSTSHSIKTIKRHASSHAMSPTNTNYRGRQLPNRN